MRCIVLCYFWVFAWLSTSKVFGNHAHDTGSRLERMKPFQRMGVCCLFLVVFSHQQYCFSDCPTKWQLSTASASTIPNTMQLLKHQVSLMLAFCSIFNKLKLVQWMKLAWDIYGSFRGSEYFFLYLLLRPLSIVILVPVWTTTKWHSLAV